MEIDSLNPILTTNNHVSKILNLVYEPLFCIYSDESLKPILATEYAEKDDLNWIVKLKKDVSFHNGEKFTSKDVIFTINSLISDDINSVYKANVSNILSVEAIDDYSINFTLKEKDPLFIYKLVFPIIPEYYFKDGGIFDEVKNSIPVGTGAYKYVLTNDSEGYIMLKKNDKWWNNSLNELKLDTIYLMKYPTYGEAIKAYKSAKVDLIVTTMSDWVKKFGTIGSNVYSFESSIYDLLIPNANNKILSDNAVRKAILYAINRENIVSKVFNSNATINDLPIHAYSKNYFSNLRSDYDVDKAKQILINGGWKNENGVWNKNGTKLRITILVNEGNAEQIKACEIIKDNLNDINISVTIKKVGFANFQKSLQNGNFELAIASVDIKNEYTILELLEENGLLNYSKYKSEKISETLKRINGDYSEKNYKYLEEILKDEVPYIGLYFRNNTLLTNKSVKGSIEPYWFNFYKDITTWCK